MHWNLYHHLPVLWTYRWVTKEVLINHVWVLKLVKIRVPMFRL